MMVFSQIRTSQVKDMINAARMQGLECHVLREDQDWTTFQFTTHFAKLSFDEMCRQNGVGIHGDYPTTQLTDALDAVSEGASPNRVLSLLNEAGFTRGMVNAYARGPFKYMCASESCGMSIPSYRGRYPASCPACHGPLITAEQWERRRVRRESKRVVREARGPEPTPQWQAGDPVPEGYMVVFGRLVKPHKYGGTPDEMKGHELTTKAYQLSAKAKQSGSKEDHDAALHAHADAEEHWDKLKDDEMAGEHSQWGQHHRKKVGGYGW